jgi:hypothetical protein
MKEKDIKEEEETPKKKAGILLIGTAKNDLPESAKANEQEIEEAFGENIEYEEISEIETSPMNEPVKVGEVSEGIQKEEFLSSENSTQTKESTSEEDLPEGMLEDYMHESEPPLDAPEQIIDEELEEDELNNHQSASSSAFDNANHHAGIAADSFIGIANQVLEIGGGFYIKIKRTKSHIYFDELLERNNSTKFKPIGDKLDALNSKNINRIKLDSADIALLRPILVEVLKSQTKKMTPEQQLIAVGISIAVKKAQSVMEIKAENKLFIRQLEETMEKYCKQFEHDLDRQEEILREKKETKDADKKAA